MYCDRRRSLEPPLISERRRPAPLRGRYNRPSVTVYVQRSSKKNITQVEAFGDPSVSKISQLLHRMLGISVGKSTWGRFFLKSGLAISKARPQPRAATGRVTVSK